jgi:hypothetical protein
MKLSQAAVVAIAILTVPTDASAFSGIELYQRCQAKKNNISDLACITYIRGFVDGMIMGVATAENFRGTYCPPKDGIPAEQARLIIEKFF